MLTFLNRYRSESLLLLALLLAGCGGADGPELAEVTGTITLDGKPFPRVDLQFVPEQEGGSPSFGGTNADGVYTLLFSQDRTGAMIGQHKVTISAREVTQDDDGNPSGPNSAVKIPAKYLKSGALNAEVKAGSNTIDFTLDSK